MRSDGKYYFYCVYVRDNLFDAFNDSHHRDENKQGDWFFTHYNAQSMAWAIHNNPH
jgi:hypothetical protein